MRVIATAGHVDHGKSTLVRALTGTDPDRWDEEKRRGLTIDLGFAFTTLPSGADVGFVDVPGHVKFLKNMLAGAGAVQAVALVVAATEGWMPQTEEHLRILELLGVEHGLTVVTMADAVDPDDLDLAQLDVLEHLDGSFLAAAPLVPCDSVTGRGLDDVRAALDDLVRNSPAPLDRGRPRLWIDRVFSARGAGTVVTGTLSGGTLAPGDEVAAGSDATSIRIRSIQSGHADAPVAEAGARVALNLAGVERSRLVRGDAIFLTEQWTLTRTLDVALTLLEGERIDRPLRMKAYIGSGEHDARVRPLGSGFARITLASPVPLAPGDRLVLRDPGRDATIGGGEVLDVAPPRTATGAEARLGLPLGPRVLASHRIMRADEFARIAGLSQEEADGLVTTLVDAGEALRLAAAIAAPAVVARLRDEGVSELAAFHAAQPFEAGMVRSALAARLAVDTELLDDVFAGVDAVVLDEASARLASHAPALSGDPAAAAFLDALDASPFAPPSPAEVGTPAGIVRTLVRAGSVVETEGVYFSASAYEQAGRAITAAIGERGPLTVGEIRDLLGSSRKHVVPLLNRLDRDGITRRNGDVREMGRRAGTASTG
ncbi:MAG TPA: selenocysteine-specific translation elongation factor [Acidimicrobiia bacterium]|nr:selenocysteine-specific translation elongation factor [Acidimicrobiia bacterium]